MTCKDCIHEDVCEKLCPRGLLPYQSDKYPAELFCKYFKNKADVVEVKHGEWLLDGRCSECLANPLTTHKSYCPNCGTKMDGERRDT